MFTVYTTAFVHVLGIRRGTTLSSYVQLWLAFLISGLGHATSILILPSPTNITLDERTTGLIKFFLFQAAVITLEDFVQWSSDNFLGNAFNLATFRTLIGYTWVVCTLWYSLPMAGDVFVRMRLGEDPVLPFTMIGPSIKGLLVSASY